MKKITFLIICFVFSLGFVKAAAYENLYLVGNASPVGWSIDNAIELLKISEGVFEWEGELLDNTADGGKRRFKFLVGRDWHPSITCRLDVDGSLLMESGEEYDLFVKENQNTGFDNGFQVAHNGTYKIEVNLNTMKIICTMLTEPEPDPTVDLTQLYLIGSATTAGWDDQNPVEMTKTAEGIFTWTGTLSKDGDNAGEFKFLNASGTWDKTINPSGVAANVEIELNKDYSLLFRPYEASDKDFKFLVTTAGDYTINVNLNEMKMSIVASSGINDILNTYPNAIEVINKSVVIDLDSNSVGIYSITGNCLNQISNVTGAVVLAENLANGIYIVKLNIEGKEYIQKIMIK